MKSEPFCLSLTIYELLFFLYRIIVVFFFVFLIYGNRYVYVFQEKDQYGNEVSRLARPLPVEYLLVDVPASTPLIPIYTFTVRDDKNMFPVENRYLDGHLQDFNALSSYISNWAPNEFLEVSAANNLQGYYY